MGGDRQSTWEHMAPTNNKPCAQHTETSGGQPGHTSRTVTPAAQDWLPTEAKQGQYLDGRSPVNTMLLLEEVLVRPAGGAHPVVCVGPNTPV